MAQAGWYPDPYQRAEHRWFDGTRWTEHVSSAGQTWVEGQETAAPSGPPSADVGTAPAVEGYGPGATRPPAGGAVQASAGGAGQASVGREGRSMLPYLWLAVAVIGIGLLVYGLFFTGDDTTPVADDGGGISDTGGTSDGGVPDATDDTGPSSDDGGQSSDDGTTDAADPGTADAGTGDTGATAASTIPPLQAGLGQLNSYTLEVSQRSVGPTTADLTETSMVLQRDAMADATYTRIETTSSTADDPEPSTSITETWQLGTRTCDFSGDEYSAEDYASAGREVADALRGLIDLTPVAPDPQVVGDEQMNGVTTRHYGFVLPGLGQESGAEVVTNRGDYWLAADGEYLVRYELQIDLRTGPQGDPNTEIYQGGITVNVSGIDQPTPISWPAGCDQALANS